MVSEDLNETTFCVFQVLCKDVLHIREISLGGYVSETNSESSGSEVVVKTGA